MHAIHVGAFRMGILLVSWSRIMRGFEQKFPGTLLVEHASRRSFLVRDYDQRALRAASDFERNCRYRGSIERPRGIIVREWCKKTGDFILVGSESIPPVTITVIDHRAGAENLPHTRDVLSGDAHNHIRKFGEAKRLLHDRTHSHVTRVLFGKAHRDGFGQGHAESITKVVRSDKREKPANFSRLLKDGHARDH